MLYEFTNREQDMIVNAFRTGNYMSLRTLPDHIAPNNVSQNMQSKTKEAMTLSSVISQNKREGMQKLTGGGGYFGTFEWMKDEYNNVKEAHQFDLIYSRMKQTEIH